MTIEVLTPQLTVPANSSRFFVTSDESERQPTAVVELGWDSADPRIFNPRFDGSLIAHDSGAYCTSVVDIDGVVQVPTLTYLSGRVLPHVRADGKVIDIGCGQGEFVERMRRDGIRAEGFDPVLRRQADYLHPRYWTSAEDAADLYVMRCVLPHIPEPWEFLAGLATSSPGALVLIEFQRLDWILAHDVWYQLSHDHVNVFDIDDFVQRYRVVDQGTFANGEWGWVLIDPADVKTAPAKMCPHRERLTELMLARDAMLQRAAALSRPLAIWGAAGKGILLGHALQSSGVSNLAVVDADRLRWDLYMETTRWQIISPQKAETSLSPQTIVMVCNPNHLDDVRQRFGGNWDVILPRELASVTLD